MAVALVVTVALVALRYRRVRTGREDRSGLGVQAPPVPQRLVEGADRTWVLFTTPYCATCGPVEQQLRAADPDARVVKVDATRDVRLAADFGVRAAPTVLLADRAGTVKARLVGAAAVGRYIADLVES